MSTESIETLMYRGCLLAVKCTVQQRHAMTKLCRCTMGCRQAGQCTFSATFRFRTALNSSSDLTSANSAGASAVAALSG